MIYYTDFIVRSNFLRTFLYFLLRREYLKILLRRNISVRMRKHVSEVTPSIPTTSSSEVNYIYNYISRHICIHACAPTQTRECWSCSPQPNHGLLALGELGMAFWCPCPLIAMVVPGGESMLLLGGVFLHNNITNQSPSSTSTLGFYWQ